MTIGGPGHPDLSSFSLGYPGREGVKGCRTFVKHVVDGALGFLEVPQNQHFQSTLFAAREGVPKKIICMQLIMLTILDDY